jgi:hypothetical protein
VGKKGVNPNTSLLSIEIFRENRKVKKKITVYLN